MIFKIIYRIRRMQNQVLSFFIKRGFRKAGRHFYIEYPFRVIGADCITIGDNFNSFGRLRIETHTVKSDRGFLKPELCIGNDVSINFDCHIGAINRIEIGNNVMIASRVFITDHIHGKIDKFNLKIPPHKRILFSEGPVIIKNNVWIGEGVAILANVTIGANCIIGANSLVNRSVPDNAIVSGNPARIIRIIT